MRRSHLPAVAVTAVLLAAAAMSPAAGSPPAPPAVTSGPCGTLTTPPTYTHVIWVWMENHSYDTIIGRSQAPYVNSLAGQCGLATNYHNISHPSLPNYIAGTSGLTWDEGEGGSSNDCATNTTDVGCHVATIVISPSTVAGTTSGTLFNHYSLPGTTEQLLGLPALGNAASFPTMTSTFNL